MTGDSNGGSEATASASGSIAEAFTADRWGLAAGSNEGLEIRLSAEAGTDLLEEAEEVAAEVLDLALFKLADDLPRPPVRAVRAPDLPEGEYEVAIDGAVRVAESLSTPWRAWWRDHPAPGQGGRCGHAPGREPDDACAPPRIQIGRAVEEALWEDPGLLVGGGRAIQLAHQLGAGSRLVSDVAAWAPVLSDLLSRRVPLPEPDEFAEKLRRVESAERVARSQHAAHLMRPYEITVRLGPKLYTEIAPAQSDELEVMLAYLHDTLFEQLGVGFSDIAWQVGTHLGERDYEISINGLPRGRGEVPERSTLVNRLPAPGEEEQAFIEPVNGGLTVWVEQQNLTDYDSGLVTWNPGQFLILHLSAVLRESAAEFTDLAWTQQLVDQLELLEQFSDYSGMSELVEAVDQALSRELVSSVLQLLADEGVGIRDLPGILQALLEAGRSAFAKNGQPEAADLEVRALELAEHVRSTMPHRLTRTVSLDPSLDFGDALTPVTLAVPVIRLGDLEEHRLEAAIPGPSRTAVYGIEAAGPLLRGLRAELRGWSEHMPPALLTTRALRRHLRRLIAAQFPRVRVLAADELAPGAEVEEAGLVSLGR